MFKVKSYLAVFGIFIITLVSFTNITEGQAKPKYIWKLAHEELAGGDEDIYAHAFKKLIEERSNGQVQINIYTLSQLGDGADQCELVQNGAIELGITSQGPLSTIVPEIALFSLHYILPDSIKNVWDFLRNSDTTKLLKEISKDYGITIFDILHQGPHWWTTSKIIRTPEDWKGVKWRTQSSKIEMASFDAYNANSTTVAFAELYTALQMGMVDGQQQPNRANNMMKYYEVTDYYTDARASYYVYMPYTSNAFLNSLPEDMQKLIQECFYLAQKVSIADLDSSMQREKEKAIKHGITWIDLTAEEKSTFAKLAVPVRNIYREDGGPRAKEVLDTFEKEISNYK